MPQARKCGTSCWPPSVASSSASRPTAAPLPAKLVDVAGEVQCQSGRERVRQLPRAVERLVRGLQARVRKPEHPLREGQVVQDVHTIVHAGRKDVRTMITWVVEAECRLERGLGGDEFPLIEQAHAGHEVADRERDGIGRAPDRGPGAVRQLSCPLPLALDVGDAPQAA